MTGRFTGKTILVVEDEYFVAFELARALRAEDATVLGPVGDRDKALALMEENTPDAAILDVNLEGADTYPVADRLREMAVPWMFLTGYEPWALPESYRDAPHLAKPYPMTTVLDAVGRLVVERETKR